MWQILLQILAIIGIIVLILVGILILLIGLVLFAPIRYRVEGEIDTTTKTYLGSGKATWLLHIISVTGGYPKPGTITIKIFGYPYKIIPLGMSEDTEKEDVTETKTSDENITEENTTDENASAKSKDEVNTADNNNEQIKEKEPVADTREKSSSEKWYNKIIYTIRKLCDKIKEIWNTIQYYKDILDDKQTRLFMERSKKRIFKLLKAITPRHLQGQLQIGTGSPDTTGYLMAIYGMLVPYLDKQFTIQPDFETAVCVGKITAKGRIFLWTALIVVIGFATDKHLSVLQRKLKREEQ